MVPYLLEERCCGWLAQLDRAARVMNTSAQAYPGHGQEGPLGALLEGQRRYLLSFQTTVRRHVQDAADPAAVAAVAAAMQRDFPAVNALVAAVPDLMAKNVAAVAKELAGGACAAVAGR